MPGPVEILIPSGLCHPVGLQVTRAWPLKGHGPAWLFAPDRAWMDLSAYAFASCDCTADCTAT
jgi:hypothetical protein